MMRAFEITFDGTGPAAKYKALRRTVRALTPQLAREIADATAKTLPVRVVSVTEVSTVPSPASIDRLVTVTKKTKHKEPKQLSPQSVAGFRAWMAVHGVGVDTGS